MTATIPTDMLARITTFGDLLRYLRRRACITQTDLSIAVGYSDAQISRLEQNLRLPNIPTIQARFVPALRLQNEPAATDRLLQLATAAQQAKASAIGRPRDVLGSGLPPSIAVLPFVNLSADPDNDYFCDGLSEELINALAKLEYLFVVARASAFSFKGRGMDVREIGRALKVAHILEGSVKKSGERLRVTAQLINADTGFHLWSERFDRQITDLFEIQDEITLAIVEKLRIKLLDRDARVLLNPRRQGDLAAYNLYLKGRYYWAQRPQGINMAIDYFNQAIAKDPNYALAQAGLADCYATLGSWENGTLPPIKAMSHALSAATKALELDDQLGEAHAALAYRTTHHDWDWDTADKQFRHALELNPNYAVAHHWYSHYLTAVGRIEESLAASKRCLELDPLDLVINIHMAWHHQFSRQYDEAVEQCWRTNELHPNSFWPPYFFALAFEQQGKIGDAVNEFEKAIKMSGNVTFAIAGLGHLYASCGEQRKATAIIDSLLARSRVTYVPAYDIGLVHAGLGRSDLAFEYLHKAHHERSGWLTYLRVEPRLDSLRPDPRFKALLQRLHLCDESWNRIANPVLQP
ncbi:MAG TPA: helix-turn-helix domain-containing protein [Steroidobacteraceae bacterium]